MTMTDFGDESYREQHNHGSGTFIGRDNFGNIRYELLDPKTRIILAKLSTDAPSLAKLLTTALRDGVISPDAVAALESAVRNINEDVADSLRLAGQNINEDVAASLRLAGQNINEDVANKFLQAADTLSKATHRLDTLPSLNAAAERFEYVVAPPAARGLDWKTRFKAFFWGAGIGVVMGALLIYYMIKG